MGRWYRCLCLALPLLLAGCAKEPTAPVVPGLHGTVTSAGAAVAGARIYVLPELEAVPVPAAARPADVVPVPVPARDTLAFLPNPMGTVGSARFSLAAPDRGVVAVYDQAGRCRRTLVDQTLPAGVFNVTWDAKDDSGAVLPGGLYTVTYRTGFAGTPKVFAVKVVKYVGDPYAPAELTSDPHGGFELADVSGSPGDTFTVVDANGQPLGLERLTGNVTIRAAVGDSTAALKTAERTVSLADIRRGIAITLVLP